MPSELLELLEQDTTMNWAICCTSFLLTTTDFDLERHLVVGNIAVDSQQNPSLLKTRFKCSKTDQLQNRLIYVYIEKTGDDICPVAAVLSFLAIQGQEPGPLFVCHKITPCIYKGALHTKTVVSTAGSCGCWPKVCGTQLPHWSHDHCGKASTLMT